MIKNLAKLPKDIIRVMVEGLERAELVDLDEDGRLSESGGGRISPP